MKANWDAINLRMKECGIGTLTHLAERSGVSVKSFTRIKKGHASNESTLNRIAKALGVETSDLLQPPDETRRREAMKSLEEDGYRYLKVLTDRATRRGIHLACARYNISFSTLTKLGPLFAVAMFEKSLAARRARLDSFNEAFDAAFALAPGHLEPARYSVGYIDEADRAERDSIAARDLTGEKLADGNGWVNEENLFASFLREFTAGIDADLIEIENAWGLSLDDIDFDVLKGDFRNLTKDDERAAFALDNGYARPGDMPDDIRTAADPAVRAEWFAAKVPAEIWDAEMQRRNFLNDIKL